MGFISNHYCRLILSKGSLNRNMPSFILYHEVGLNNVKPYESHFSLSFPLYCFLVEELVSSLCVCSYGQVKWPVLANTLSMAGRSASW